MGWCWGQGKWGGVGDKVHGVVLGQLSWVVLGQGKWGVVQERVSGVVLGKW